MTALYTQVFFDYLADRGENYLPEILGDFPTFSFGENDVDFADLFRLRFGLEEIGDETPERFDIELRRKAKEVYVAYAPVLDAYLTNLDKLTDRSVEDTDTTTVYDYINPTSASSVALNTAKLAGSQKTEYEKRVFVNTLSPAEQIKQIADLYHIYNDAIEEFAVLFMGVQ